MFFAIILSALSGYLALSYEIVWIRVYALASGGTASVFALVLGYYLFGLAGGAWLSRQFKSLQTLSITTLGVSIFSFLFIPLIAWVAQYRDYSVTMPYIGFISILLGFNLPLLSQYAVRPTDHPGSGVSYLYFANIIGSVTGTLVTGFVLFDLWSLQKISIFLACFGFVLAVLFYRKIIMLIISLVLSIGCYLSAPLLFENVYERLIYKKPSANKFVDIIENKHGVITVSPDGVVFGSGIYDGQLRIDLKDDRNKIIRAFAILALHPEPKNVLMIGLSTGSWAQVIADDPRVKKLTIIEINPGYLKFLKENLKTSVIIDDGRRWLRRNPEQKFDLIVMNTTFHWRAHVSNLLSKEFLEMARSALNPRGIFYYNTTGSKEALRTAVQTYPYALRIINFVAVSDSPIRIDKKRWFPKLDTQIESRDSLLRSTANARVITDDNMGTEWRR